MPQAPDGATTDVDLRARVDDIDTRIHQALMERAELETAIQTARESGGATSDFFDPERDADSVRQMVERHQGSLPLTAVEHIWRDIVGACSAAQTRPVIYLDGGAELIEMLDLARFNFGFATELDPCSDAADVVDAVGLSSEGAIGLVALTDRAELPWWRGLSEAGAQVRARLPFVMLDERPADLPALVLARSGSLAETADVAVYDARWSDVLPGRLMDQGIEVLSFFRSANGVDALLAISGELTEEDVRKACVAAGAEPDVLRCVGGYAAPIDADGDEDDEFGGEEPQR
ncbi:chorismate mutase [Roseibium sp. HPY-6]|uniref:chorismate mutase n=1 Tax=Roseibium sp. HPY-6 TaxID=3229852 RepID=UPI00338E82EA